MKNIVILDSKPVNPGDISFKKLEKLGNLTVYKERANGREEIIKRAKDADILLVCYARIDREIVESLPKLEYIGLLSTGFDNIDLDACRENNVAVTNVPSYGTEAVAQFSLALLLEIVSRVGHHDREVKNGRWMKAGFWYFGDYPLIELYGKTIGIIGLGKIGLAAAKIYKAMGMEVLAYNRSEDDKAREYVKYVNIDAIYEKSDIIDLHLPLTEKTKNIIDEDSISKMKDGVIIINTARGGLVDEKALMAGIDSGKVFAAGLDVNKTEPINCDNPLLSYKNIILTPHMAWGPGETRNRLVDIAIDNIFCFERSESKNRVD
ncbi:NAD(P)-dependent oxidoreductase [uncultured Anaerococcus sp.]|uniref:NAD(P)-dependent oxidoreductase n=1 Tax=uncultured Anaerococcus sp. TaxID=293428 RepID=UPI0025EDD029|nr:NAD(P)-dependent oxidoreductase [uncultured Anaerococcus sp.]